MQTTSCQDWNSAWWIVADQGESCYWLWRQRWSKRDPKKEGEIGFQLRRWQNNLKTREMMRSWKQSIFYPSSQVTTENFTFPRNPKEVNKCSMFKKIVVLLVYLPATDDCSPVITPVIFCPLLNKRNNSSNRTATHLILVENT